MVHALSEMLTKTISILKLRLLKISCAKENIPCLNKKKISRKKKEKDFLFMIAPLFSCALYLIRSDTAL